MPMTMREVRMPIRGRAGKLTESLSADTRARVVTVSLAYLVVVMQALFGGARGVWSVLVVAGVAAAAWLIIRKARPRPGDADPPRPADFLAIRAGVIAGLAGLVVVGQAVFTGYIGWWSILAVAIAAAIAFLNSKRRLVLLMLFTAAGIAAGIVFVSNMFTGSPEARTLAVAIAAVVVPLFVSDKFFGVFREPELKGGYRIALLVLTLVFGMLGWVRANWLPGVMHGCFTPPTSAGMTVLKMTEDGSRCFGLLDTSDPGVFAQGAFGQDPVTISLENWLLTHNQPLRDGDLTVVWLGALSCEPALTDVTKCADGRDYPAERDQLRALILAQSQVAHADHHLHVVIADATQDVAHADDIARLVIQHREAFGSRLVVIGGGDSRDQTLRTINHLLDNGIPFIASNLLADLGRPGQPFVERPGYLQLPKSNMDYVQDAFNRLSGKYPHGFRLDIYQLPNPTDQFTTSLVNDLLGEARAKADKGVTARHISSLDKLDNSICGSGGDNPAAMLFFADRWTKFMDFLRRINDACGDHPPQLVMADSSASRFMANYELRETSNVAWPVDYYVGGPGCADLSAETRESVTKQVNQMQDDLHMDHFACADPTKAEEKYCTLDAAAKLVSQPCTPNDLGPFLLPAFDAVRLADRLVRENPGGARLVNNRMESSKYLRSLQVSRFPTSESDGSATVKDGQLDPGSVPIRIKLWRADPVDDPAKILELGSSELTPASATPSLPPWWQ
jgi:hypothetical protein